MITVNVICKNCGKSFDVRKDWIARGRGKFCCHKCYFVNLIGKTYPKKGLNKICPICKTIFYVPNCLGKIKCCSKKCGYIFRTSPDISGSKHPNWKGGEIKTQKGYVSIYKPDHPFSSEKGYFLQHRLVIEGQIGRHLKLTETVHHLGKKSDNRPFKLMAFVNNSAHQRFHRHPENVKPEEIIFDGRSL
jgi:hypothetical protein